MKTRFSRGLIALTLTWLGCVCPALGQSNGGRVPGTPETPGVPKPDKENVPYGPDAMNVLDLWQAKTTQPAPLVMFIHGGGFSAGKKEFIPPGLVNACLKAGISVISVEYRLSPRVVFPAHYMDCARALQFARSSAEAWHIDPTRVAISGGSAGAGTSLWLAFHDDMADPASPDPVARQSTRVSCALVYAAQSTYDPRVITEIVGKPAAEHSALPGFYGLKPAEFDTDKAHKLFEAASPANLLSKDDPPVLAVYTDSPAPVNPDAPPGTGIHHPNFGYYLQKKMAALGIECVVQVKDAGGLDPAKQMEFLRKHLGMEGTPPGQ